MATTKRQYHSLHPGLEQAGEATAKLHIAGSEGWQAFCASNYIAAMEGKATLMALGGLVPYTTAPYTVTLDHSGTFAYGVNGLQYTSANPATDGDNGSLSSIVGRAVAQDNVHVAVARIRVSSNTNVGLQFGFATVGTTDLSAGAADAVYISKSKSASAVIGKVIQGSGSSADSGTLLTMQSNTEYRFGVTFKAGSSAANSWGYWSIGSGTTTAVMTPMTSAQVTAVYNLGVNGVSLGAFLGFKVNGTTVRNGVIRYALAQIDF